MNKFIFFALTLTAGIILFAAIISNVGAEKIVAMVFTLKAWQFAVLIILNCLAFVISSFRWKIILNANGSFAPFKKILAARLVGFAINYITPTGLIIGEPFKAVVLSGGSAINLGSAMVSIVIEGAIFLSTFLFFVALGIFSFITYSDVSRQIFAASIGALIFMMLIFYLFYSKMIKKSPSATSEKGFFTYIIDLFRLNKIPFVDSLKNKIIRREAEIKKFFALHRNIIFTAVLLSVLEMAVSFAAYWLTISFLGFSIEIRVLLGIVALMSVVNLLPLPGSLGGFELSQVFAFSFFNLGGQVTALAFSLITRIISLLFVAIGIIYLIGFEMRLLAQKAVESLPRIGQKIRNFLRDLF